MHREHKRPLCSPDIKIELKYGMSIYTGFIRLRVGTNDIKPRVWLAEWLQTSGRTSLHGVSSRGSTVLLLCFRYVITEIWCMYFWEWTSATNGLEKERAEEQLEYGIQPPSVQVPWKWEVAVTVQSSILHGVSVLSFYCWSVFKRCF